MKKLLFIPAMLFSVCFSFGQKQFSGWLASFNTFKTGKHTSIHSDIQLRSTDKLEHVQTLLLRVGLNLHLNKKFIVTAGYAYIHNQRKAGNLTGYVGEHRIWQQAVYNHKIERLIVAHRFRLEERFIPKIEVENNELNKTGNMYAGRFRYFVRNIFPLRKYKTVFAKGAFATLQNEVFLNVGNKNAVNGKAFDQNRLLLAAGYRLSSSLDMEAGYMNQYIQGRADAFTNNHIVQLAMYLRL
ncbi:MAG: DUF2490 domain-containing protein [Ferruginibacter sp.]